MAKTKPKPAEPESETAVETSAGSEDSRPECFVIMPISDVEEYPKGHFKHVFDDVFVPACDKSGYRAVRADSVRETNMIHLDVLQRILTSPMAICDLSSRNPNVLFELGLRQAFDMPVVLVQEKGTPRIFDIAPLRYTEYRRARVYHEVIEDQNSIAEALDATRDAYEAGRGVNSIVRILGLTKPASLDDVQEADKDPAYQLIRAEISELRSEFRYLLNRKSDVDRRRSKRMEDEIDYLNLLATEIGTLLGKTRVGPGERAAELPELLQHQDRFKASIEDLQARSRRYPGSYDRELSHLNQQSQIFDMLIHEAASRNASPCE